MKKFKNAALIILTRLRADKVLAKLRLAKTNAFLPINGLMEQAMLSAEIGHSLYSTKIS